MWHYLSKTRRSLTYFLCKIPPPPFWLKIWSQRCNLIPFVFCSLHYISDFHSFPCWFSFIRLDYHCATYAASMLPNACQYVFSGFCEKRFFENGKTFSLETHSRCERSREGWFEVVKVVSSSADDTKLQEGKKNQYPEWNSPRVVSFQRNIVNSRSAWKENLDVNFLGGAGIEGKIDFSLETVTS